MPDARVGARQDGTAIAMQRMELPTDGEWRRPELRNNSSRGVGSLRYPFGSERRPVYHRRPIWCMRAGDTDGGGLDMVRPLAGLMMGIALRARVAAGWCSLRLEWWVWKVGGTKAGEVELREKVEATCCGCCVGEALGELLDSDDRSDDPLLMDTISLSVSSLGQNSMSSSRSNERLASNCDRKADTETDSLNSFMLLTPRNCLWEFWETDSLGARRFRPPWWLWGTVGAGAVGWW